MNVVIFNPQKAECFAGIFQHIKVFTEHINIFFEKERMYIQAMDNSRISILEVKLPAEWFDVYEHTTTNKSITIGVNSSILFRVLNAREKTQKINLVLDSADDEKLAIHFTPIAETTQHDAGSGGSSSVNVLAAEFDKHFEISLIDVDEDIMLIPEMDYEAEFTIASSNFANIINQLKMFGDNLELVCSEEKIVLYSNSVEQGKMFVEIKIDDLSSFVIDEGETIKMSFSLKYLYNICLYNKLSKEMDVKFKNNFPMKIVYNLIGGCGKETDPKMIFFLAPKIMDDDDNEEN